MNLGIIVIFTRAPFCVSILKFVCKYTLHVIYVFNIIDRLFDDRTVSVPFEYDNCGTPHILFILTIYTH